MILRAPAKINWFLKFADITTQADEFIESATMNPAFEESAMFENMIDLMFKDEYDFYVFDTAPTANARRLRRLSNDADNRASTSCRSGFASARGLVSGVRMPASRQARAVMITHAGCRDAAWSSAEINRLQEGHCGESSSISWWQ